jgi:Uncharacterized conserved protein
MHAPDPFHLTRFLTAQAQSSTYASALAELRAGRKRTHWMWFIFPQVAGLGSSSTAQFYAIASRAEADAYLAHPILGPRLRECTAALLQHPDKSAAEIMGHPDDIKLRSSMTLFSALSPPDSDFQLVLDRFFDSPDERTLAFLARDT